MGNKEKFPVEVIENYHLILDTKYYLDLMDTFYVPSITRNLISLSKLLMLLDMLLRLRMVVLACLSLLV